MNAHAFLIYLATWCLIAVTPGPAVLCVMGQSVKHGPRASFGGILGIQLVNLGFFLAAATGLAALITALPHALDFLRVGGAVYLAWLGVTVIAKTFREPALAAPEISSGSMPSFARLFLDSALVQVANPKALLFISALLPQFIDPQKPLFGQVALLGGVTFPIDIASLCTYAWLAHRGAKAVRSTTFALWLRRVFGAALIGFGGRLFFSR